MTEQMSNKMKDLTIKWEQAARGDLLYDEFNESLQVNKGLHAFQESTSSKLTEDSYRAQACLLNASLALQFEGAHCHLGPKRVQEHFLRYDQLVCKSEELPKTQTLKEFQRYAKSCFYYRLGDYFLASLKPAPEAFDKNLYTNALCVYAISLDHLCSGVDLREIQSPAEAFNILELYVLLVKNVGFIGGFPALREALRAENFASKLISQPFHVKRSADETDLRFLKTDAAQRAKSLEFPKINAHHLMAQIWNARRQTVFLRRFLWVRAHFAPEDDAFLSNLVTRFADFPQSLSRVYDVQDFSLFDLKVLLYRMSAYMESLEIRPKTTERSFLYPPHFQPHSSKQFTRIWSIVNVLCDNGDYSRDKQSDRIMFVGALEEIRQGVPYEADLYNLAKTATYLWNKTAQGPDSPSSSARELILDLFERYANAIVRDQKPGDQTSRLFPPIQAEYVTAASLQSYRDHAYYLLAQRAVVQSDFSRAKTYISNMSEVGRSKESVKVLLDKVHQRDSKNVSPSSIGSFQMVDGEVKSEDPDDEENALEETFMTCASQTAKPNETRDQTTVLETTQIPADETLNFSKAAMEQQHEDMKRQLQRQTMCDILDCFIETNRLRLEELKTTSSC